MTQIGYGSPYQRYALLDADGHICLMSGLCFYASVNVEIDVVVDLKHFVGDSPSFLLV